MASTLARLRQVVAKDGGLDYDQAKAFAQDDDPSVRIEVARQENLAPELMYFLAEDTDPKVRQQIARHPGTPPQADLLLTADNDEQVRTDLAEKISRLAPGLTPDQQDKVKAITYQALLRLAQDQLPKVRQVVADALKDVADAPPEVILHLAHDAEIQVSGPVLECSPVLNDEDLLEIISSQPVTGALSFISRRKTVAASVADAIVDAEDADAITFLLQNDSAQIREETLDRLIDRAPDFEQWHQPMVERSELPKKAALRLAQFVAHTLVQSLLKRRDLDPATAAKVETVVNERLESGDFGDLTKEKLKDSALGELDMAGRDGPQRAAVDEIGPEWERALEEAFANADQMLIDGALDERAVANALQEGMEPFITGALAVLASLPLKTASKILDSHDSKGISALVWKAGLSAKLSVEIQTKVGKISPDQALQPSADGDYPMSESELEWQIELFS